MKHTSFVLKANAAVLLFGAALAVHADSTTATVNLQLNSLAAGTCSVTPAAATFALPGATAGTTAASYVATNFPIAGLNSGRAAGSSLDQTFHLMCGSTVSITSMTIAPVTPYGSYPSMTSLKDTGNKYAFGALASSGMSGLAIFPELVTVNGVAAPFSFKNATTSGPVPVYTTAFSVGTTPVPVVWRPMVQANWTTTYALTTPADSTGYRGDFLITVNY